MRVPLREELPPLADAIVRALDELDTRACEPHEQRYCRVCRSALVVTMIQGAIYEREHTAPRRKEPDRLDVDLYPFDRPPGGRA